ncbi:MAG: hypothetical protein LBQ06_01740 [Frankiaceae bacterium]|nr:hypothetical protein [Frankiaceae bacterium]
MQSAIASSSPSARPPTSPSTQQATPPSPGTQPATPYASPSAARALQDTWQSDGSQLTAYCDKVGIHFVSAQPADGYAVELEAISNEQLTVAFESSTRKPRKIAVVARCNDSGAPTFKSTASG